MFIFFIKNLWKNAFFLQGIFCSLCTHHCTLCCLCVFVRTLTGLGMLVCSMDGTVAYLDFSLDELGDPLNEEEKVRHTSLKLDYVCTLVLATLTSSLSPLTL